MRYFNKPWRLLLCMLAFSVTLVACGGGGGGGSAAPAGSSTAATVPVVLTNVVPIVVDNGPAGNAVNVPYATVTVCQAGSTSQCQTIDHVLLDTGSTGLRVLSSVLSSSLNLPVQNGASGFPLLNCSQFLDGSFTWGPVVRADVSLGSNTASNLPIQVIADQRYNATSAVCGTGQANATVSALGAKGILGIGLFQQDCGPGCANVANNGVYYTCSSAACTKAVATTVAQTLQLQNPAGSLTHDNNGLLIDLPAVAGSGAVSTSGSLYFGIGTQTNNGLGAASVQTTDNNGYITTAFGGKNLATSFIDTGSNGLYFDTATITRCTGSSVFGFYCPAAATTLTAVNIGANGTRTTVTFGVDSASRLLANTANSVLPQLSGPVGDSQTFDWGLPFFLGRRVFIGFESRVTGTQQGPFFAY